MLKLATKFRPERETFEVATAAGFEHAEFWLDAGLLLDDDTESLAREFGLEYALHCPNVADLDGSALCSLARLSVALEASAVVIHEPMYQRYASELLGRVPTMKLAVENHRLNLAEFQRWAKQYEWLTLDVEHLWKFTLADAPLEALLSVLHGFLESHAGQLAHVHLPGYLPAAREHRPISHAPTAAGPVLSLLADFGFAGLIVSEADPEYQTIDGLRQDMVFFETWRRARRQKDAISFPMPPAHTIPATSSEALLYETHSHTPLCKHATGDPEEYAAVAEGRGLQGLIVTCHNPLPDGHSPHLRMSVEQFPYYVGLVERAADAWAGRVDVRLGLEADYLPGYESWLADQLGWAEFHFVLGSVHPHTAEYRAAFADPNPYEAQRVYFRLLARAAETGLFDSLAHPDLIKNETAGQCRPQDVFDDVRRALDRIAETGMAMELNTSGVNKLVAEMNPSREILMEMQQRGIPVTLGADAHQPERVADRFEEALSILSECGYQTVSLFLERERHDISIRAALNRLRERSPASAGQHVPTG